MTTETSTTTTATVSSNDIEDFSVMNPDDCIAPESGEDQEDDKNGSQTVSAATVIDRDEETENDGRVSNEENSSTKEDGGGTSKPIEASPSAITETPVSLDGDEQPNSEQPLLKEEQQQQSLEEDEGDHPPSHSTPNEEEDVDGEALSTCDRVSSSDDTRPDISIENDNKHNDRRYSEDSIDYAHHDDDENEVDGNNENTTVHEDTTQKISSSSTETSTRKEEKDAWNDITKRDKPLLLSDAATVTAEVEKVLITRFENADEGNFKDVKLRRFDHSLARFQKLELQLGRRIASGNFADIFSVRSYEDGVASSTITTTTETEVSSQRSASATIKHQNEPKNVAVKLLRSNLLRTPALYATAAADLVTEGTLLAALAEHPNVVTILGRSIESTSGFSTGRRDSVFLVLERLDCDMTVKLREWRERAAYKNNRLIHHGISGRRDNKAALLHERLTRMSELASAMTYLHRHDVIHRDLKLSNIGLDMNGSVKLLDFGLAKILPPCKDENTTFRLTGNTGSIRYVAPEVARGDEYNLKADCYSFSILLYEVMNLSKAFASWDPMDIIEKVHKKKHRPTTSLFWPKPIRDLLKSTWSDIPAARLSMHNVQIILDKCLEDMR